MSSTPSVLLERAVSWTASTSMPSTHHHHHPTSRFLCRRRPLDPYTTTTHSPPTNP
ncbi:hypothetical protein PGT21_009114 [Puccinia graminis f. sp. tritici]|uniref:Uncharacterized protein n=1 Tax=Puccinia graminis f. sp. tritici TaxID=56615 RepID=A0A5B0NV25_PUCGR|nr:hypothetical protein PGT21_009114 [Puccinia graminis f. sp. tritici]